VTDSLHARVLVMAKAPAPGRVKTRLGNDIGPDAAAEVAAACLLDTLVACSEAVGPRRCHLALDGDLADAVRGTELERTATGWARSRQRGAGLAARLVQAHADVAPGPGPVVQIGMDTPQVSRELLSAAAAWLETTDSVLGPAEDGGWWLLAVRDTRSVRALAGVAMSTPTTYADTRRALERSGLTVATTHRLRDVDTVADARAVAGLAPGGHFARAWSAVARSAR